MVIECGQWGSKAHFGEISWVPGSRSPISIFRNRHKYVKQVKPGFTTIPAAKATQFQGNRHLIVGVSYLNQELGIKKVNFWKIFLKI